MVISFRCGEGVKGGLEIGIGFGVKRECGSELLFFHLFFHLFFSLLSAAARQIFFPPFILFVGK